MLKSSLLSIKINQTSLQSILHLGIRYLLQARIQWIKNANNGNMNNQENFEI